MGHSLQASAACSQEPFRPSLPGPSYPVPICPKTPVPSSCLAWLNLPYPASIPQPLLGPSGRWQGAHPQGVATRGQVGSSWEAGLASQAADHLETPSGELQRVTAPPSLLLESDNKALPQRALLAAFETPCPPPKNKKKKQLQFFLP